MANHHEPLQALGPIDWDDVPLDSLKPFVNEIFADAQTVVESIPSPTTATATATATTGRARSKTDSAVLFDGVLKSHSQRQSGASLAMAQQLRKEWKEIKVNVRDNPLGISVYKLAAKDGKGAWFARRSVHEGISFDAWKTGLAIEFAETMKVQGSPGSGNIRGIGADKSVENREVEDTGHLSVFQLSAQFPGPTSPRDFITLLLTTDFSHIPRAEPRPLRQYIVVSKPCVHPECPQRPGIIRGQYESVELIREIPIETASPAAKRSLSSTDLTADDNNRRPSMEPQEGRPMAIEWLMVTRSDPGGSVPRFMVEKGTPPGIVGDAGKFVNWVTAKSANNFAATEDDSTGNEETTGAKVQPTNGHDVPQVPIINTPDDPQNEVGEGVPSSNGIYGIISGVFGVASSVVASGLWQFSSPAASNASQDDLRGTTEEPDEQEEDDHISSETSSIRSFTSALEKKLTQENRTQSVAGSNSDESKSLGNQQLDKELRKLQDRRRKLDEKAALMQKRLESKQRDGKEKDDAMVAKVREKHEKEVAKQEAKYKRELQKLEEKREQEERKAEARRRKTVEREEKLNLTLELEKVKAERDVALKRIQILQGQVGELQAQNTMLVAKLGRMGGIDRANSSSSKGSGIGSTKSA